MDYLAQLQFLGFIALSMILGGAIGYERELANKPAGMRTHMLVSGAATLLVLLGDVLVTRFGVEFSDEVIRSDPIRIIEAIVTGVAFLGAGTIIRSHGQSIVHGLTTAASLLFTAAIGICVALEVFGLAVGGTVLVLATLRLAYAVEYRVKRRTGKE